MIQCVAEMPKGKHYPTQVHRSGKRKRSLRERKKKAKISVGDDTLAKVVDLQPWIFNII